MDLDRTTKQSRDQAYADVAWGLREPGWGPWGEAEQRYADYVAAEGYGCFGAPGHTTTEPVQPREWARPTADVVQRMVERIDYAFGRAGRDALARLCPGLEVDLAASIRDAYLSGYSAAAFTAQIERGEASERRTFAMVSRVVHSAVATNDPILNALTALAGFADVGDATLAGVRQRRAEERTMVVEARDRLDSLVDWLGTEGQEHVEDLPGLQALMGRMDVWLAETEQRPRNTERTPASTES